MAFAALETACRVERAFEGGLDEQPQLRVLLLEDDSTNTKGGEEKEEGHATVAARHVLIDNGLIVVGRKAEEACRDACGGGDGAQEATQAYTTEGVGTSSGTRSTMFVCQTSASRSTATSCPSGTWSLDPGDQRRLQPEHEPHIYVSFLKMTLRCKRPGTEE
ncbi:hypothetical protein FIBSPDRAFT_892177 [Athelia psychrophila]|uniref:Uncharacterized protein n=1 Tax=Athelia psychrophila TaxID=1759441 RepID=A0A166IVZ2_9AGAM|nr:hypothetical protein FIBSPDRAFT_892177 [Fibularhizoctonia sp. CBS 109695]